MLYSKTTNGFYAEEINGTSIPEDAVAISDAQYGALLQAQSKGGTLGSDVVGFPVVTPLPPLTSQEVLLKDFQGVKSALQAAIDAQAIALGFSSGNAFMLYAGFTNAYKATATKFATWEVSVWVAANAYKDQVVAGTANMVTPEQAVAMMPAYPL